jgi:hypothetical protein
VPAVSWPVGSGQHRPCHAVQGGRIGLVCPTRRRGEGHQDRFRRLHARVSADGVRVLEAGRKVKALLAEAKG